MNKLVVDGKEIPCKPGWIQLGDTLGAYRNTRLGFQLETTREWNGVITWNGTSITHLGPRSRRTLRFGEEIPTPYYYPGHVGSDWFDGGLYGMDMCGTQCRTHDWDRIHARCPVFGLIDITTGKPLRGVDIASTGYSLERSGETSVLPGFGPTDEVPFNGQHDLRRRTWGVRIRHDEFVKRDCESVVRDMALVWDRKRAASILKGPKNKGSYEIGREWAFVLMASVDARNVTMTERMLAIAEHVQHPYGNLQLSSGGNPAPPSGAWFSDAEAHYQTVALKLAGRDRMARKLADVSVKNGPRGKYLEVGTGRGSDTPGGPTHGTSWAAMACGVYTRTEFLDIAKLWKVGPDYNGAMHGPYSDILALAAKLDWWNQSGKTLWAELNL